MHIMVANRSLASSLLEINRYYTLMELFDDEFKCITCNIYL